MLRDQPERHSEFFALYVFGDDSEYRAKLVEAGQQHTTPAYVGRTGGCNDAHNDETAL